MQHNNLQGWTSLHYNLMFLISIMPFSEQFDEHLSTEFILRPKNKNKKRTTFTSGAHQRMLCSWQVRVLISLFPPFLLELYKLLIAPIQGGKIAALMVGQYFLCHNSEYLMDMYMSCHVLLIIQVDG